VDRLARLTASSTRGRSGLHAIARQVSSRKPDLQARRQTVETRARGPLRLTSAVLAMPVTETTTALGCRGCNDVKLGRCTTTCPSSRFLASWDSTFCIPTTSPWMTTSSSRCKMLSAPWLKLPRTTLTSCWTRTLSRVLCWKRRGR